MRRLPAYLGALLFLSAFPARADTTAFYPTQTPFYVPREVFLGTYVGGSVLVPQAWLKWEEALYQRRADSLLFVIEGGGGYAAKVPHLPVQATDLSGQTYLPLSYFYEYSATAEFGYRMDQPYGMMIGFHVGAGPMWYGARSPAAAGEKFFAGTVIGRANFGWHLKKVTLGITGGFSGPFGLNPQSYSRPYVGGFVGGIFINWR